MMHASNDYYVAIDPVDEAYTPISNKHGLTLIVYFALSAWALFKLKTKGANHPPLMLIIIYTFSLVGIVLSGAVAIQIFGISIERSPLPVHEGFFITVIWLIFVICNFPVLYIILSLKLMTKAILSKDRKIFSKQHKNKILNFFSRSLEKAYLQPAWALVLLAPILLFVTSILMLFGQEADALSKAFTDTSDYYFSQKSHPPYLDHKGHYLCTVAVCGSPWIVKPLRLGRRHGREIVVNRQLLVANAFEELIQTGSPRLHKFIRGAYDQYGYPLSKHITSPARSNVIYLIMKPLEYFFVVILYLFVEKPEQKISQQYSLSNLTQTSLPH
jgi:hypothetical protein